MRLKILKTYLNLMMLGLNFPSSTPLTKGKVRGAHLQSNWLWTSFVMSSNEPNSTLEHCMFEEEKVTKFVTFI